MTTPSTSALPAGVTHVTITCDKVAALLADGSDSGTQADGAPLNLDVEFVAPVDWERYPGSGLLMLDQPVRARVINGVLCDQLGTAGVGLIAPREGWTWTVRLLQGRKLRTEFPILVAASPATQRLDQIMVASAIGGEVIVQGESAYQVAVRNGYVGTEAQWLASLKGEQGAGSMARGSATDLNTLTGAANAGAWTFGSTATGHPSTSGIGVVVVAAAGTHTSQTATLQTGDAYVRYYAGSAWSAWRRIDHQDTGWRDITSLWSAEWLDSSNTGRMLIRRQGDRVTMAFDNITLAGGSGSLVMSNVLPVGFASQRRSAVYIPRNNSLVTLCGFVAYSSHVTWISGRPTSSPFSLIGELSWFADQAFPSTLPGTPV